MHCIEILKKLCPTKKNSEQTALLDEQPTSPSYQSIGEVPNNAGEISNSNNQHERGIEEDAQNSDQQKNKLLAILYNLLNQNPKIVWQAIIYAASDAAWSGWSYAKNDYSGHPTENESFDSDSQWFGQLVFATAVTFLITLAITGGQITKKEPVNKIKEVWVYFIAASLGICIWQFLQVLAKKLADKFNMSATDKEYFANFTPTTLDGLSEALILFAGDWCINTEQPKYIELGLNTLTGIFSSAVWQGLYLLGVNYKLGAISTAALVAGPLTLFNIATGLGTQTIIGHTEKNKTLSTNALIDNISNSPITSTSHSNPEHHAPENAGVVIDI